MGVRPLVSSNPKLGTSGGGLGAYATKFDPDSRLSLIGGKAEYSSTQSIIASLFARTSFSADHQRITGCWNWRVSASMETVELSARAGINERFIAKSLIEDGSDLGGGEASLNLYLFERPDR